MVNYAIFAKDAYNTNIQLKPSPIVGYLVDRKLSTKNATVYYNPTKKDVILSIRGTDFSKLADLKQDALVVANKLEYSKRLKNMNKLVKTINQYYPQYNLILVGHSLGGSIVQKLVMNRPKRFKEAHSYNPGTSPVELLDILKSQISCLIYPDYCKKLRKKNIIHVVKTDPISLLSQVTKIKLADIKPVNAKVGNPHTIDNFV